MKKPPKKTDWSALQRDATAAQHREQIAAMEKRVLQHEHAIKDLSEQLDIALAVNRAKLKHIPQITASNRDGEAAAVVMASDWHVEEVVRPEAVSGLNEYNLEIADARIKKFFGGIHKLTRIERAGIDIKTLVLILGGDFLSGYIHEELEESNELSPTQTIIWLRDRLVSGINSLRSEGGFDRIVIPCVVGNHGRTTKKKRIATSTANSYEWLLYHFLARELPDCDWHIAEGYHLYLDVFGKILRIHHGDGLRYQGGIGGLTIPLEKAIAAWNKGRVADLDLFGHWHTFQQSQKWLSNGSLIGYSPFAVEIKAPFEPPQQTYFLLDAKRGRTGTWPIFVS